MSFAALAILAGAATAMPPEQSSLGTATDPVSGRVLYTQQNTLVYANGELAEESIEYRDAESRLIARKQLSYEGIHFAPNAEFERLDSGVVSGVRNREAGEMLVLYTRKGTDDEDQSYIPGAKEIVVDVALRRLMLEHFDELAAGGTVTAPFVSLSSAREGRVHLRRVDAGQGEGLIRFQANSSAPGLFPAGPALYGFDAASRRLMTYEGPSDLPAANGPPQRVRVRFDYDWAKQAGRGAPPAGVR